MSYAIGGQGDLPLRPLYVGFGRTHPVMQRTPVSLTPKAFDNLICLLRNQGRMVTKDELLRQVWPDTFVEEVNLAVNISTIRKALGENPQDCRFIATVPGRGYRFIAQVATGDAVPALPKEIDTNRGHDFLARSCWPGPSPFPSHRLGLLF